MLRGRGEARGGKKMAAYVIESSEIGFGAIGSREKKVAARAMLRGQVRMASAEAGVGAICALGTKVAARGGKKMAAYVIESSACAHFY